MNLLDQLISACIKGNVEEVDRLISQGADPSAPNVHGIRPLSFAAMHGRPEVALRLLEDPRVDPSLDQNIFPWAVARGHSKVVEKLLQDPRIDSPILENT